MYFFYDTETSGLPLWHEPSSDPRQPHIVQIAAALVDPRTREIVERFEAIIRPDGWEIPAEVAAIHGITTERALELGEPAGLVLARFLALHKEYATLRIGHEESFDCRMVRIAMKRHGHGDEAADAWKAAPAYCTCWKALPVCKVPKKKGGGFKKPTLAEAHRILVGAEFENAHTARADVDATMAVFWALQDHHPSAAIALAPEEAVTPDP